MCLKLNTSVHFVLFYFSLVVYDGNFIPLPAGNVRVKLLKNCGKQDTQFEKEKSTNRYPGLDTLST